MGEPNSRHPFDLVVGDLKAAQKRIAELEAEKAAWEGAEKQMVDVIEQMQKHIAGLEAWNVNARALLMRSARFLWDADRRTPGAFLGEDIEKALGEEVRGG